MGMHTLGVLTLLASGLPLSAQSWDALRELKPGDAISVLDTTGHERKGGFTGYSADAIALQTGGGEVSIERPRVRRVQVRSKARRTRNALIGVAIGVAVSVAVDQTLGAYLRNEGGQSGGGRAVTYIAPIALFGGVGALPAYRTVYRAR
jgi:hypothetical protein